MNYNHIQLDASINRARPKEDSPAYPKREAQGIFQPSADPNDPYTMTHVGIHEGYIKDEAGNKRPFVFYIPSTMKTSGNNLLVFTPGKAEPSDFFEDNGWKEILEKYAVTAYFLGAPSGWNTDDPGFEMDAAAKVVAEMRSMEYFPYNAPGVYCMGFEDGANIASVFSILNISVLAAWAAWGDTQLDDKLLEMIGNAPSDCDDGIKKAEVPLPAFIIDENGSNTLEFFKKACRVKDENLRNDFAYIFRQQPKPGESYINDPACSEVWHSDYEQVSKIDRREMIEKMVAFVEDYKRWGGEGNAYIRKTERPEDIGLVKTEMMIDGLKRYWHTFEPSSYKRKKKDKYPLVIAIHGFSCSGGFFAENSGWHRVGEERGAIVVYPNAYPFDRTPHEGKFGKNIAATPAWNTGMSSSGIDPKGPDEISFFKKMLEVILETYPIDEKRIYVTGHSNGSMMAQLVMRHWPEKFAGFAPVGAMESMTKVESEPDDGYLRNVWYVLGEYDIFDASLKEGGINYLTLNNLCDSNKIDYSKKRYYETGIYENTIIRDDKGVPLVRFTRVKNWPHTYSPELSFMIYDEFFARFVRNEDGTLEYLA